MSEVEFISEDEAPKPPEWRIEKGLIFFRREHLIPIAAVVGIEFPRTNPKAITITTPGHRATVILQNEEDVNAFIDAFTDARLALKEGLK